MNLSLVDRYLPQEAGVTVDECPMCMGGIDFDAQRLCQVCYGRGVVLPGFICKCGRSAGYETPNGAMYCGRDTCKPAA